MEPTWLHGLLEKLSLVIVLVLSLSVHEWAHAFSASLLGDDTARRLGRLTLNPAAHIDPVGTLLLPLLGIPFGWAKPVPVNPARFTRKLRLSTGMMITAAAGPFSNLLLALACAALYTLILRLGAQPALLQLLKAGFLTNVALAVFNMLPIPPLDGSRVAEGLMPFRLRPTWERFARFGPLVLIAIMLLPQMGIHVLNWPMSKVANGLLYVVQFL